MKTVFVDTLRDIFERWPIGVLLIGAAYLGYYYANWEHHQGLVGHVGMQQIMMEHQAEHRKLLRFVCAKHPDCKI